MDNTKPIIIKTNDILNNQIFYYRVHFYNGNFYAYNRLTGYLLIKDITSFIIEKDIQRNGIRFSTLDKPIILDYYLKGWRYFN